MGTLVRILGAGLVYFCTATLLAQAAMLGYLWSQGWLSSAKLAQVAMVLRGGSLPASARPAQAAEATQASVTLADIEAARAVRLRQFELREQSAHNVLAQVRFETEQVKDAKDRFDRVYETFKQQLGQDKVTAITRGNENARLLLESIKPNQSKELIMQMLAADEIDEVVTLFSAMQITRQAKIAAEFKDPEETKKLDEILRRIRRGLPDAAVIEATQKALEQTADEP
jgi:hypothetical protein